jgi:hypothetical protein
VCSSSMCSFLQRPVSYEFRNYSWTNSELILGVILFLIEAIITEKLLNPCSEKWKTCNIMKNTYALTISQNRNLSTPTNKILHVPNKAISCLTPKKKQCGVQTHC